MLWLGAHSVSQQEMSFGELTQLSFTQYSWQVHSQLLRFGRTQRAMGASERLSELMNIVKKRKRRGKISNVIESDKSFWSHFDHVTFSYPSNPNKKVLDNICFNCSGYDCFGRTIRSGNRQYFHYC